MASITNIWAGCMGVCKSLARYIAICPSSFGLSVLHLMAATQQMELTPPITTTISGVGGGLGGGRTRTATISAVSTTTASVGAGAASVAAATAAVGAGSGSLSIDVTDTDIDTKAHPPSFSPSNGDVIINVVC
jgi:hypothetical protein